MIARLFFSVMIVIFICISCKRKYRTIYLKMPDTVNIRNNYKVEVRYQGVNIGQIISKPETFGEFLILRSTLNRPTNVMFTDALFREDILGNNYIELFSDTLIKTSYAEILNDTIIGKFAPTYRKVDSFSREKIIKGILSLKKIIDTISKELRSSKAN